MRIVSERRDEIIDEIEKEKGVDGDLLQAIFSWR
jgi:hypothetical protein